MTQAQMVEEMIGTVTQSISGILSGIGSAIVDFFDVAVLTANNGLTTFATWALAFLGVSFGLGAIGWIVGKVGR